MMPVQEERIQVLNDRGICRGDYVLYWMQQSQRAEQNHALDYAIDQANGLGTTVLVAFGLMDDYPEANLRHYAFMLEGLKETRESLATLGIRLVVRLGHPAETTLELGRKAVMIVCDRGYLRHQKAWRDQVAAHAGCRVVQVEADVVVPVEVVSHKAEYAARTIRPRLNRRLDAWLVEPLPPGIQKPSLPMEINGMDLENIPCLLRQLRLDRRVPPVSGFFTGGTSRAKTLFREFLSARVHDYVKNSNQPQTDDISYMSAYLHFGQISPLYLAGRIRELPGHLSEAGDAYLEQLIVRRELAMNFVNFTPDYDSFACLPQWAHKTLEEHRHDPRDPVYTYSRLESAETHDPYWNAAMREMIVSGYMHNYMRMYWGKKILEWSEHPEIAYKTALALNNTWFLDGRDPNSYAGVAWLFGVHDRAWAERPVFGKVRYMAASGLERKCDISGYVRKTDEMSAGAGTA